jgi:chromosome segregation ATPase
MDECQVRLNGLPPDTLEARNLRNEIEMAMAGLRHLLSCVPQGRALSVATQSSSGTGLEAALNARLNRLRETMQREESRLEFLRQERERQELRSRTRPAIDPALREQESKIRLAQEQLAMTEAKIKRAAMEEQSYREKIATLRLQLAELRTEFSHARETGVPLAS